MSPQLLDYCEYPYINTYFQKGVWQLPATFPACLHEDGIQPISAKNTF